MLASCSASSSSATRLCIRSVGIVGQRRPLHAVAASDPSPSTSSPSKPLPTSSSLAGILHSLNRHAAGEFHSQFVERFHRQSVARLLDSSNERIEMRPRQERRQVEMTAITMQLNQRKKENPAVVGNHIKGICETEGIEKGVERLKSLPLDLQDAVAWNTVIAYAVREGRFQFAFELFNEMKRRGLNPTPFTYITFSCALSNSDSPGNHPKHTEIAHSLLEQYKRLAQSLTKGSTTIKGELVAGPFNLFIKYFGRLGDFDTVFDIYNSMEDECGVPPDNRTFSTLFYALPLRKTTSKTDGLTISQQNASDVRLLWRDLEQACAKHKFEINSVVLTAALSNLKQGRESDIEFAFKLVQNYIKGITASDRVSAYPRIPVDPRLMVELLRLCNAAGRPEECLKYLGKFKIHVERMKSLETRLARLLAADSSIFDVDMLNLDKWALDQCIVAYAMLAYPSSNERDAQGSGREDETSQSQSTTTTTAAEMETSINDRLHAEDALDLIRWSLTESAVSGVPLEPILATWNVTSLLCWLDGDWLTARELFYIMVGVPDPTGYALESRDDVDTAQPQSDTQCQSRKPMMSRREPSLIIMNSLAQTALSIRHPVVYHQFLSLFNCVKIEQYVHYRISHTSSDRSTAGDSSLEVSLSATGYKGVACSWPNHSAYLRFIHRGFLSGVKEICQYVLSNPEGASRQDLEKWGMWSWMCGSKLER